MLIKSTNLGTTKNSMEAAQPAALHHPAVGLAGREMTNTRAGGLNREPGLDPMESLREVSGESKALIRGV